MVRRCLILLLIALMPLGFVPQASAGLFSKRSTSLSQKGAKDAKSAKKAKPAKKAKQAKMQNNGKRWLFF